MAPDNKKYILIDVNKDVKKIVDEVERVMFEKMRSD